MNAQTVLSSLDAAYRNGIAEVTDPGSAGTVSFENKGVAICKVVTAAAESRVLGAASGYGVGTVLIVILKTDGGDLTITGSEDGSVVLDTHGDLAQFIVTDANGTNKWRTATLLRYEGDETTTLVDDLPIDNDWRVWDSLITSLAAADGTDDLGLVTGTYLTSNPTFNVTIATPAGLPYYARRSYVLPKDYSAGTDLVVSINVTETVAATTASLDLNAVDQDTANADIVATAAQSCIAAAATTFNFTITGTNLVPGDTLDLRPSITLTDVAATPNYSINSVKITRTALLR